MEAWDRDKLFRLIPEARAFEWMDDLTPVGSLWFTGTPGQAIAYGELFWPSFVEYEGCILREKPDPANFSNWMSSTKGDKRAVEAMLNHLHIVDVFGERGEEASREQILHLGRRMREMWVAKLDLDFPSHRFEVSFPEGDLASNQDYEISFFQS